MTAIVLPWAAKDDDFLRTHFAKLPHAELASRLGRTAGAVRHRCSRLGLRKMAPSWTDAEVTRLRSVYEVARGGPVGIDALAREFGRPKASVSEKAAELGLASLRRRRPAGFAGDCSRRAADWHANNTHPRGMKGKRHSTDARRKMADGQQRLVAAGTHPGQRKRTDAELRALAERGVQALRTGSSVYSRCKHGRRADLDNRFFRSAWEANYARFLNFLQSRGEIASWEYEADTFWFEKIRRGVRSYTPDFKVRTSASLYYVEVKGWMDPKSKTKLARMKKYHPGVEVRVFDAKAYRELSRKLGPALPGWES